jgi:hypothetical protein
MPIRPENRHRYGSDWKEFSHRIRFERAGGRCECHGECGRGTHIGRCTNEHGKPAYGTGSMVVLTTAHLTHEPECRDDDKVKAMCQACHLHYDRDHHAETAYLTRKENAMTKDMFDETTSH